MILRFIELNYNKGRFFLELTAVDTNDHDIKHTHTHMRYSVVVNINFPAFVKRYVIACAKTKNIQIKSAMFVIDSNMCVIYNQLVKE